VAVVDPFDFVLFGGTGDLAMRKLLPSLYLRHRDGAFPEQGRITGTGRKQIDRQAYIDLAREACERHLEGE